LKQLLIFTLFETKLMVHTSAVMTLKVLLRERDCAQLSKQFLKGNHSRSRKKLTKPLSNKQG